MLYIEGRSAKLFWEVHALRHDALRLDSLREGAGGPRQLFRVGHSTWKERRRAQK